MNKKTLAQHKGNEIAPLPSTLTPDAIPAANAAKKQIPIRAT
jgi:hypothetical protein